MITEIWNKVWEFRKKHADVWFAPEPKECIMYAIAEMGEYFDACVYQLRPEDTRANLRERIPEVELADTIIMIVSAFTNLDKFPKEVLAVNNAAPIVALRSLCDCLQVFEASPDQNYWEFYARTSLYIVVTYLGEERAIELVEEKLKKIEAKVLKR